jgi:hypothetical protein
MNNEAKTGRGGARPNSGMKASGIETVTVRIDKRLLNAVTIIKAEFKDGKSLDDIISKSQSRNDDAKLQKEYKALKIEHELFVAFSKERINNIRNQNEAKIEKLNYFHKTEVGHLEQQIKRLESRNKILNEYIDSNDLKNGNLDDKLRKRLIQFCHPDLIQDPRKKAIAEDLTKALNGLAK